MPWWATILSLLASPGLAWALVSAWKYQKRMNLLQHAFDNGGTRGVRAVGEAIAVSEGRHHSEPAGPEQPPSVQATAEREQPKAIEAGDSKPSGAAEPPP